MTENEEFEFRQRLEQEQGSSNTPEPTIIPPTPLNYTMTPTGQSTGYFYGPKEAELYRNLKEPVVDIAKGVGRMYTANPLKLGADILSTSTVGAPVFSSINAYQTMEDRAKKLGEAYKNVEQYASATRPTVEASGKTWKGIDAYREMYNSLKNDPQALSQLSNAYHNEGGAAGVKRFIESPAGKELASKYPDFATGAAKYVPEVPGVLKQAGRLMAPVARTALNVLGPAATAYDLYQAGQTARETQLGPRLQQGQGQLAPQMYRQGMGMTYQGPQLSQQEQQNVKQNASPRDMAYFQQQNDPIVKAIRQKAAEKVLGPVAPGSF